MDGPESRSRRKRRAPDDARPASICSGRRTGLDPAAKFDEAKAIVLATLKKWDALPPGIAATTWQFLSKRTPADDATKFKSFLETLASVDAGRKTQALSDALSQVLADKPELKWLQAIADRGILAIAQDLDRVSALAAATLAVLNGDVMKRLHDFIGDSLDLGPIRQAAQDADFGTVNEWLVGRLGDLIDEKTPGIDQLKEVQKAIFAVDRKVKDVYETGIEALTKRYTAGVCRHLPAHEHGHGAARRHVRPVTAEKPRALPKRRRRRRLEHAADYGDRRRDAEQRRAQPRAAAGRRTSSCGCPSGAGTLHT